MFVSQAFFSSKNEAALHDVSALDSKNELVKLTGMSLDYADKLMGAQVVSFNFPFPRNFEFAVATVITETRSQFVDNEGRPFEGLSHGVLTLSF